MASFTQLFTESQPSSDTPLAEAAENDAFQSIKELAKKDLGVLKQVTYLWKLYHGDDPRFTAKEAQTAMNAVLSSLVTKDDRSAFYMGTMEWKPNLPVWMRFFDMVKENELGGYLGISNQEEIPSFGNGSDVGGEDEVEAAFT